MTLSSKKTQARPISMKKQLHQEGSFPYYRLGSIERFLLSDRQKKDAERGASKARGYRRLQHRSIGCHNPMTPFSSLTAG